MKIIRHILPLTVAAGLSAGVVDVKPISPIQPAWDHRSVVNIAAAPDGTFLIWSSAMGQRISAEGVLLDPVMVEISRGVSGSFRLVIPDESEGWISFETPRYGEQHIRRFSADMTQSELLASIRAPLSPIAAAVAPDRILAVMAGEGATAVVSFDLEGRITNWQSLLPWSAASADIAWWNDQFLIAIEPAPFAGVSGAIELFTISRDGFVTGSTQMGELSVPAEVEIAILGERAMIAYTGDDHVHAQLVDRSLTPLHLNSFASSPHWRYQRNPELASARNSFLLSYTTVINGAIASRLVRIGSDGAIQEEHSLEAAIAAMASSDSRLLMISEHDDAIVFDAEGRERIAEAIQTGQKATLVHSLRTATIGDMALVAWREEQSRRVAAVRLLRSGATLDDEPLSLIPAGVRQFAITRFGDDFAVIWTDPDRVLLRRLDASGEWKDAEPITIAASDTQWILHSPAAHWDGKDLALGWSSWDSAHLVRVGADGSPFGEQFVAPAPAGKVVTRTFFVDEATRRTFGWGTGSPCQITCVDIPSRIHFGDVIAGRVAAVRTPDMTFSLADLRLIPAGVHLAVVKSTEENGLLVVLIDREGTIVSSRAVEGLANQRVTELEGFGDTTLMATSGGGALLASIDLINARAEWLTAAPRGLWREVAFPWRDRLVWTRNSGSERVLTGRISTAERADLSLRIESQKIAGRRRVTDFIIENRGPAVAQDILLSHFSSSSGQTLFLEGVECSAQNGCRVAELAPGETLRFRRIDRGWGDHPFRYLTASVSASTTDINPDDNSVTVRSQPTHKTRSRGVRH